jgi:hypothetical protein
LDKKYLPIVNRRNPHPLKNCLDNFKKSWGDLDKLSKINENWKNLIGLELFQECKPLNIEKNILTIAVNHPQWRQALIYNKHKLKERIEKIGITLNEIKIIQNYEIKNKNIQATNAKIVWAKHPSRITQNNIRICTLCNSPTPEGEIKRWGKCSFCWRKINN